MPSTTFILSKLRLAFGGGRETQKTVPDFDIGQLEAALTADSEHDDPLLMSIHISLLKAMVGRAELKYILIQTLSVHISLTSDSMSRPNSWEKAFRREISKRLPYDENPLEETSHRPVLCCR